MAESECECGCQEDMEELVDYCEHTKEYLKEQVEKLEEEQEDLKSKVDTLLDFTRGRTYFDDINAQLFHEEVQEAFYPGNMEQRFESVEYIAHDASSQTPEQFRYKLDNKDDIVNYINKFSNEGFEVELDSGEYDIRVYRN